MSDNTTTIEIHGCKFEVDLRHAKRIDELRVGDRVKVLTKDYSGYTTHHGIIIGFEPFQNLPTVTIAYVESNWSEAKIKFLHYNAQAKDIEVVKALDDDRADLDKANVVALIDKQLSAKQSEIETLEQQKRYFLEKFRTYWEPVEASAER